MVTCGNGGDEDDFWVWGDGGVDFCLAGFGFSGFGKGWVGFGLCVDFGLFMVK